MKTNSMNIVIDKKGSESVYFIRENNKNLQETTVPALLVLVKERQVSMIEFETVENQTILLAGYLIVREENQLIKQLKKAAKAQILW